MSGLDIPHTHATETPEEASASVAADKYDQMLALADLFDSSGNEMRTRARLGVEILSDDDVVDSGWTLTEATRVLREAGAGPVLPLVLALDA